MATSPEEQVAKMIASLKTSTGKTLLQWSALVNNSGKAKHGELVSWLKSEHGVTHGYASLIAHRTLKSDAGSQTESGTDLVAEMLAGDKVALRPIFEALMTQIARTCFAVMTSGPRSTPWSLHRVIMRWVRSKARSS